MPKYKAVVEYDGTAYHGWQLQKDLPTVQGELESTLERILRIPTRIHAAGRTDAGVHARGQVAHFCADWRHPVEKLQRGCNALLPPDIAIHSLEPAADEFHARHSAVSKIYVYTILNRAIPSPLHRLYSWHIPLALDRSLMAEAAECLLGTHDFAAFGAPTEGTPSTVRRILATKIEGDTERGNLKFSIQGTGFLRYMVRSLVGTLVDVGKKRIKPADFADILRSRDRSLAGATAPPQGLCLHSVHYDTP
jgi:tRNA pseudouridine38-40 synthase